MFILFNYFDKLILSCGYFNNISDELFYRCIFKTFKTQQI